MSRPGRYFSHTMLISAQSIALDCDSSRFSRSAFSEACICTVNPSSLLACSAIFEIAVTGGPAWRSVTSLMFCAQIVGNPRVAPLPMAVPARAEVMKERRLVFMLETFPVQDVMNSFQRRTR